jgi:release factor glutamine methyltransferase
MQVRDALKIAAKKFEESSTPALDARLLLASAMCCSQEELLINYDSELKPSLENDFFNLVVRREAHEPIAYILEKQEFYGLDFYVNKNVLIPRPDTELIIDFMISDYSLRFANEKIDILELGVGSGAISVCLAKEIILAEITAVDISNDALQVAKTNILNHQVHKQVNILKSDWYLSLAKDKKYDYIISNPPYICRTEINQMSKEAIMHEPDLALFADNNGLSSYQTIIQDAHDFLKKDGKLVLEIGHTQKDLIISILKSSRKLKMLDVKTDLSGINRLMIAGH